MARPAMSSDSEWGSVSSSLDRRPGRAVLAEVRRRAERRFSCSGASDSEDESPYVSAADRVSMDTLSLQTVGDSISFESALGEPDQWSACSEREGGPCIHFPSPPPPEIFVDEYEPLSSPALASSAVPVLSHLQQPDTDSTEDDRESDLSDGSSAGAHDPGLYTIVEAAGESDVAIDSDEAAAAAQARPPLTAPEIAGKQSGGRAAAASASAAASAAAGRPVCLQRPAGDQLLTRNAGERRWRARVAAAAAPAAAGWVDADMWERYVSRLDVRSHLLLEEARRRPGLAVSLLVRSRSLPELAERPGGHVSRLFRSALSVTVHGRNPPPADQRILYSLPPEVRERGAVEPRVESIPEYDGIDSSDSRGDSRDDSGDSETGSEAGSEEVSDGGTGRGEERVAAALDDDSPPLPPPLSRSTEDDLDGSPAEDASGIGTSDKSPQSEEPQVPGHDCCDGELHGRRPGDTEASDRSLQRSGEMTSRDQTERLTQRIETTETHRHTGPRILTYEIVEEVNVFVRGSGETRVSTSCSASVAQLPNREEGGNARQANISTEHEVSETNTAEGSLEHSARTHTVWDFRTEMLHLSPKRRRLVAASLDTETRLRDVPRDEPELAEGAGRDGGVSGGSGPPSLEQWAPDEEPTPEQRAPTPDQRAAEAARSVSYLRQQTLDELPGLELWEPNEPSSLVQQATGEPPGLEQTTAEPQNLKQQGMDEPPNLGQNVTDEPPSIGHQISDGPPSLELWSVDQPPISERHTTISVQRAPDQPKEQTADRPASPEEWALDAPPSLEQWEPDQPTSLENQTPDEPPSLELWAAEQPPVEPRHATSAGRRDSRQSPSSDQWPPALSSGDQRAPDADARDLTAARPRTPASPPTVYVAAPLNIAATTAASPGEGSSPRRVSVTRPEQPADGSYSSTPPAAAAPPTASFGGTHGRVPPSPFRLITNVEDEEVRISGRPAASRARHTSAVVTADHVTMTSREAVTATVVERSTAPLSADMPACDPQTAGGDRPGEDCKAAAAVPPEDESRPADEPDAPGARNIDAGSFVDRAPSSPGICGDAPAGPDRQEMIAAGIDAMPAAGEPSPARRQSPSPDKLERWSCDPPAIFVFEVEEQGVLLRRDETRFIDADAPHMTPTPAEDAQPPVAGVEIRSPRTPVEEQFFFFKTTEEEVSLETIEEEIVEAFESSASLSSSSSSNHSKNTSRDVDGESLRSDATGASGVYQVNRSGDGSAADTGSPRQPPSTEASPRDPLTADQATAGQHAEGAEGAAVNQEDFHTKQDSESVTGRETGEGFEKADEPSKSTSLNLVQTGGVESPREAGEDSGRSVCEATEASESMSPSGGTSGGPGTSVSSNVQADRELEEVSGRLEVMPSSALLGKADPEGESETKAEPRSGSPRLPETPETPVAAAVDEEDAEGPTDTDKGASEASGEGEVAVSASDDAGEEVKTQDIEHLQLSHAVLLEEDELFDEGLASIQSDSALVIRPLELMSAEEHWEEQAADVTAEVPELPWRKLSQSETISKDENRCDGNADSRIHEPAIELPQSFVDSSTESTASQPPELAPHQSTPEVTQAVQSEGERAVFPANPAPTSKAPVTSHDIDPLGAPPADRPIDTDGVSDHVCVVTGRATENTVAEMHGPATEEESRPVLCYGDDTQEAPRLDLELVEADNISDEQGSGESGAKEYCCKTENATEAIEAAVYDHVERQEMNTILCCHEHSTEVSLSELEQLGDSVNTNKHLDNVEAIEGEMFLKPETAAAVTEEDGVQGLDPEEMVIEVLCYGDSTKEATSMEMEQVEENTESGEQNVAYDPGLGDHMKEQEVEETAVEQLLGPAVKDECPTVFSYPDDSMAAPVMHMEWLEDDNTPVESTNIEETTIVWQSEMHQASEITEGDHGLAAKAHEATVLCFADSTATAPILELEGLEASDGPNRQTDHEGTEEHSISDHREIQHAVEVMDDAIQGPAQEEGAGTLLCFADPTTMAPEMELEQLEGEEQYVEQVPVNNNSSSSHPEHTETLSTAADDDSTVAAAHILAEAIVNQVISKANSTLQSGNKTGRDVEGSQEHIPDMKHSLDETSRSSPSETYPSKQGESEKTEEGKDDAEGPLNTQSHGEDEAKQLLEKENKNEFYPNVPVTEAVSEDILKQIVSSESEVNATDASVQSAPQEISPSPSSIPDQLGIATSDEVLEPLAVRRSSYQCGSEHDSNANVHTTDSGKDGDAEDLAMTCPSLDKDSTEDAAGAEHEAALDLDTAVEAPEETAHVVSAVSPPQTPEESHGTSARSSTSSGDKYRESSMPSGGGTMEVFGPSTAICPDARDRKLHAGENEVASMSYSEGNVPMDQRGSQGSWADRTFDPCGAKEFDKLHQHTISEGIISEDVLQQVVENASEIHAARISTPDLREAGESSQQDAQVSSTDVPDKEIEPGAIRQRAYLCGSEKHKSEDVYASESDVEVDLSIPKPVFSLDIQDDTVTAEEAAACSDAAKHESIAILSTSIIHTSVTDYEASEGTNAPTSVTVEQLTESQTSFESKTIESRQPLIVEEIEAIAASTKPHPGVVKGTPCASTPKDAKPNRQDSDESTTPGFEEIKCRDDVEEVIIGCNSAVEHSNISQGTTPAQCDFDSAEPRGVPDESAPAECELSTDSIQQTSASTASKAVESSTMSIVETFQEPLGTRTPVLGETDALATLGGPTDLQSSPHESEVLQPAGHEEASQEAIASGPPAPTSAFPSSDELQRHLMEEVESQTPSLDAPESLEAGSREDVEEIFYSFDTEDETVLDEMKITQTIVDEIRRSQSPIGFTEVNITVGNPKTLSLDVSSGEDSDSSSDETPRLSVSHQLEDPNSDDVEVESERGHHRGRSDHDTEMSTMTTAGANSGTVQTDTPVIDGTEAGDRHLDVPSVAPTPPCDESQRTLEKAPGSGDTATQLPGAIPGQTRVGRSAGDMPDPCDATCGKEPSLASFSEVSQATPVVLNRAQSLSVSDDSDLDDWEPPPAAVRRQTLLKLDIRPRTSLGQLDGAMSPREAMPQPPVTRPLRSLTPTLTDITELEGDAREEPPRVTSDPNLTQLARYSHNFSERGEKDTTEHEETATPPTSPVLPASDPKIQMWQQYVELQHTVDDPSPPPQPLSVSDIMYLYIESAATGSTSELSEVGLSAAVPRHEHRTPAVRLERTVSAECVRPRRRDALPRSSSADGLPPMDITNIIALGRMPLSSPESRDDADERRAKKCVSWSDLHGSGELEVVHGSPDGERLPLGSAPQHTAPESGESSDTESDEPDLVVGGTRRLPPPADFGLTLPDDVRRRARRYVPGQHKPEHRLETANWDLFERDVGVPLVGEHRTVRTANATTQTLRDASSQTDLVEEFEPLPVKSDTQSDQNRPLQSSNQNYESYHLPYSTYTPYPTLRSHDVHSSFNNPSLHSNQSYHLSNHSSFPRSHFAQHPSLNGNYEPSYYSQRSSYLDNNSMHSDFSISRADILERQVRREIDTLRMERERDRFRWDDDLERRRRLLQVEDSLQKSLQQMRAVVARRRARGRVILDTLPPFQPVSRHSTLTTALPGYQQGVVQVGGPAERSADTALDYDRYNYDYDYSRLDYDGRKREEEQRPAHTVTHILHQEIHVPCCSHGHGSTRPPPTASPARQPSGRRMTPSQYRQHLATIRRKILAQTPPAADGRRSASPAAPSIQRGAWRRAADPWGSGRPGCSPLTRSEPDLTRTGVWRSDVRLTNAGSAGDLADRLNSNDSDYLSAEVDRARFGAC